MIYITFLMIIAWAIFRGIDEGIDMHQPSNRVHWWYRHYHWFPALRDIFGFAAGGAFVSVGFEWLRLANLLMLASMFPLAWQIFENAYGYTRYRRLIPDKENFFGCGTIYENKDVVILHIRRWAVFVFLFGVGILL